MSLASIFTPQPTDVQWTAQDELIISLICRTDSYKFSHPFMFKQLKKLKRVKGMTSYGEARVPRDVKVTVFGGQMLFAKFFSRWRTSTLLKRSLWPTSAARSSTALPGKRS